MAFDVKDPPPLPPPNVRIIDPATGLITPDWYPYLKGLDAAFRAVLTFLRAAFP